MNFSYNELRKNQKRNFGTSELLAQQTIISQNNQFIFIKVSILRWKYDKVATGFIHKLINNMFTCPKKKWPFRRADFYLANQSNLKSF